MSSSPPALSFPPSRGHIVNVSLIHGGRLTLPTAYVFEPPIAGYDVFDFPCYSFLIESENTGQKVLYDLGTMKEWKTKLPPASAFLHT